MFDSGLRVSEVANLKKTELDFVGNILVTMVKGNRQEKACFTDRTKKLLQEYLNSNGTGENLFGVKTGAIQTMLKRLKAKTGVPCNPHSFRRGFACNLHNKGLSTLDIMYLGRWKSLSMVERYTRSLTFDDCLKHYQIVNN